MEQSSAATRPVYTSIRRELWENRSIYLAPLIIAGVVLFATLIGTIVSSTKYRRLPDGDPAKRYAMVVKPIGMSPAPIMFTTILVALFYSIDAMYGERRDRSMLFWKSMPVSDRVTVLSKASIPLVILPLVAWVLSVATQVTLMMLSSPVIAANGLSPAAFWHELRFFQGLIIMFYGLAVHALWFAPIYMGLMLVSAWARRAPFLWVLVPLLAVAAVEKASGNTAHFLAFLRYRFSGAMAAAFVKLPKGHDGDFDRLSQLTPGRFLSTPGLWAGFVFAALCLFIAIRVRRNREPL
jgi:ABC-2 type transport system permease protein